MSTGYFISGAARHGQSGIGWPIWAALASAPWLLPTHTDPWPTAYTELLVAALLVPVAIWLLSIRKNAWPADLLACGFVAASLVPIVQALSGKFLYSTEAPLASLYLLGVASTIVVARTAEDTAPGRLVDALFGSLLIAGIVSTGLALAQWLSIDTLGALLAPMPMFDRPVANVGQPNNLATMLVWGLIAVWRAHWKCHVGSFGAVAAAAFLLVGITLTQSRAGFLQVMLIVALALFGRRKLGTATQFPAWTGLLVWFFTCYALFEPLTRAWTEQVARPMLSTASPRERLMLLQVDFAAIAAHPWTGYGWNQNITAHVAMAERFPMHGMVGNAHNLVLDLLIWNGVPLGLLMTGGLFWWCWRTGRRLRSADDLLVGLAVATFTLHTMLELPHVLAFFLIPVAVMVGTLGASIQAATPVRLPRLGVCAAVLAWVGVLCSVSIEYGRIETEEVNAAIQAAWPGTPRSPGPPRAVLLAGLQDGLHGLRTLPKRDMGAEGLSQFRRAVVRYPRASPLFRYAQAAAINGKPKDAGWALERLCALYPVDTCEAAARDWALLSANGYPEMAGVAVPAADRPSGAVR